MNSNNRKRFFRLTSSDGRAEFERIKASVNPAFIFDTIEMQLGDLIKSMHPERVYKPDELAEAIAKHLGDSSIHDYGVWVFYPWSQRLVHLLDEHEFGQLRTNRNKLKITAEEQNTLSQKRIGLIGLSVGHAVATTLALERGFGELRVADFDLLDLSNLNRIRSGVHNIGLRKTQIVEQEIAELDPFLSVNRYDQGISEANLRDFLTADGGLDLLIDECDSLSIKLSCRAMARELGIPVLMETSDRGMLDVERFDQEPERPLLHGLMEDLSSDALAVMPKEEMISTVKEIINFEAASPRLQMSMYEIGKTISTWPQLGADVTLGGASVAYASRNILLGQGLQSGRYYVDLAEMEPQEPHEVHKTGLSS